MKLHIRIALLQRAFDDFQMISQWIPWQMEHAAKYHNKAESIIDYLEVVDCGSIGGYDNANPIKRSGHYELYDRFLTVLAKHNNQDDLKNCCYFTPQTLGDYFKKVYDLRETFNK